MGITFVGIGVPGSGKTTVLEAYARAHDLIYISPDRIREEISGDATIQSDMRQVWETAYTRMHDALQSGKSVVFDATQYKVKDRRLIVEKARESGAKKVIGVYFEVSLPVALVRNRMRGRVVPEYAIERMFNVLAVSPPSLEDGFDELIAPEELSKFRKL